MSPAVSSITTRRFALWTFDCILILLITDAVFRNNALAALAFRTTSMPTPTPRSISRTSRTSSIGGNTNAITYTNDRYRNNLKNNRDQNHQQQHQYRPSLRSDAATAAAAAFEIGGDNTGGSNDRVQSQSISLYALTGAIFSPSANAAILAFAKAHLAAVTTAVSILMEQFLWCPLVYGTFEIPVSTLMNGGEPSSIRGEVKNKLNGLLVSNAKVWTLANLVIYNAPLEWRLFIGNVIDIFWQSIVSDVSADCGGPGQEECEVEVEVDGGDAIAALFDPNYDEQQGEELLVLASTGETKQQQRNSSDLVGVGTSLVAEKSRI
mmetsp:Transcript_24643/g.50906  ORF Transcript_24643/g.50906 Transcript_24643/m.50906 type:complete len:322 (+) Transcript_24643:166-1131(+)